MGEGSHFSSAAEEFSCSLIQRLNYAGHLPQLCHVRGSQHLTEFVQSERIIMDITKTVLGYSRMGINSSFSIQIDVHKTLVHHFSVLLLSVAFQFPGNRRQAIKGSF